MAICQEPGAPAGYSVFYLDYQAGVLANYMPYTPQTESTLGALAELQPLTLATMHGSTFVGDGGQALRALAVVIRETMGT